MAVLLIGSTLHTMEFETMFHAMAAMSGPLPVTIQWASGLIVLAAVLQSAQFPLQGWLIQVTEAPTPVSALLHAGIVNGGAFLVMRMSPIMSQAITASDALAIIGLVTIAAAGLVMPTQTSIKVFLAWTTTAQMGFMLLECGLGVYSLAMLVFFAILLIQQSLPNLGKYPIARRSYVHLYNGLYVDIPFSRLVQRFWPIQAVPYVQPKGV